MNWWLSRLLAGTSRGLKLYTQGRFWGKARRMVGRLRFLRQAAALYYCATDARTPWAARAFALLALAYFVVPIDLLPDGIPVAGFVDDGVVIALALRVLSRHVTAEHRRRAEGWPTVTPGG